jgi:hypothetical protein
LLTNNYLIGVTEFRLWQQLTVTGNTFIGGPFLVDALMPPRTPLGAHRWSGNRYFADPALPSPGPSRPFFMVRGADRSAFDFDAWRRATGFDKDSRFYGARPRGVEVFVRANQYEPGRGHIVVYNWDRVSTAQVDLSGLLRANDRFEIRDAQNPFGEPIVRGRLAARGADRLLRAARSTPNTSSALTVSIPLTRGSLAEPVGTVPTPPPATAPDFRVFLVTRSNR